MNLDQQLLEELDNTNIGELLAAKKIIDSEANKRCVEDLRDRNEEWFDKEEAQLDHVAGDEPDDFNQVAEVEDIYA